MKKQVLNKKEMENRKVYNLIIVDASASMSDIYPQALQGINNTIKTIKMMHKQSETIEQYITLLTFSNGGDKLEYIYREKRADLTRQISERDYQLRCSTALYDAIGEGVSCLHRKIGMKNVALVTIITDGYENDSKKWTGLAVKTLIDKLRKEDWVFTYIGANQDAEVEALKMGVVNSMRFEATTTGTQEMFEREAQCRQRWNERFCNGERDLELGYFNEDEITNIPQNRLTPRIVEWLDTNEVFVFGSDIRGTHRGGAAWAAYCRYGAVKGECEGYFGQSYAIPTAGCSKRTTAMAIKRFLLFAQYHQELKFFVTPIGCGHAGWDISEMKKLFQGAKTINNICLPMEFWK